MQALARLLFFLNGLLALVAAARIGLDETALALWRRSNAVWGPDAAPVNMAMLLAVGFAYLYATLSPSTFVCGVRLRIGAFVGLHLLAGISLGQASPAQVSPALALVLATFYAWAGAESDGRRRERKHATVPIA